MLNGEDGPVVEAVVSSSTAEEFGNIRVGDVLVVAPSIDSPLKVSARVVGIVVARDPKEPYWQNRPDAFLSPRVPTTRAWSPQTHRRFWECSWDGTR